MTTVGDSSERQLNGHALSSLLAAAAESYELREALTLNSDDLAPRAARSFTRKVLTDWGFDELADRALLIVSELTTNARHHGRTKPESEAELITLTLAVVQDGVVDIELADNSPEPPTPRVSGPGAVDGRGLLLISAEADAWTVRLNEDGSGKTVRAVLTRRPVAASL
ncbi:ATP-binding protein [Streptomyces sp. NPDC093109]|uniref:ATP-binding protein n=1 Tax=Streptomyces sp. NPDC093109 TaxID=3154977 RepID=UPI00344C0B12